MDTRYPNYEIDYETANKEDKIERTCMYKI